jgi:hypothetical protein
MDQFIFALIIVSTIDTLDTIVTMRFRMRVRAVVKASHRENSYVIWKALAPVGSTAPGSDLQ